MRSKKEKVDKLVDVLHQTIAGDEKRATNKKSSFKERNQQHEDDQVKLKLQLDVLAQDGCGLNRISMTTKELFETNDKLCKQLYGFANFEFLIDFLESAFDVKYEKPKNVNLQRGNGDDGLGEFEQILLTLLWTKTYWYNDVIGVLFGIKSTTTVGNYIIDGCLYWDNAETCSHSHRYSHSWTNLRLKHSKNHLKHLNPNHTLIWIYVNLVLLLMGKIS